MLRFCKHRLRNWWSVNNVDAVGTAAWNGNDCRQRGLQMDVVGRFNQCLHAWTARIISLNCKNMALSPWLPPLPMKTQHVSWLWRAQYWTWLVNVDPNVCHTAKCCCGHRAKRWTQECIPLVKQQCCVCSDTCTQPGHVYALPCRTLFSPPKLHGTTHVIKLCWNTVGPKTGEPTTTETI